LAKKYLGDHKRIENAIDAYYNDGGESSSSRVTPSVAVADPQRLNLVYNTYKGPFFNIPSSEVLLNATRGQTLMETR
jgi:hypothetical protein